VFGTSTSVGSSTVKIYPDSITIGGTRLAKITEAGSLDTTTVNNLIEVNEDTSSVTSTYTLTQIELALNNLQGGTANQVLTKINGDSLNYSWGNPVVSTFDTTFIYKKISALEDSVISLRASINYLTNIMIGYGISLADIIPPAKPTNFVAVGGTSPTQYVADWTNPTDADLDSLRFYEGSVNDSTQLAWITSLPKTDTAYTRTGRTPNTTYWSAVKAVDDSGNVSYFSNIDSAKTLATAVSDTGFYKFDAEDGLANLVLTNGSYITDTTGFYYAGSKSYKIRGNNSALNVYATITSFPAGYADEDTVWVTYRVYIPSFTTTSIANNSYLYLTLLYSAGAGGVNGINGYLGVASDGSNNIYAWAKPRGTVVTTNFTLDAWNKVEIKYIAGTDTNAVDSVYIDQVPIYGTTTGTSLLKTDGLRFGYHNWVLASGDAIYFDDIIFSKQRLPLD
jgi:hypothetical protein